MGNYFLYGTLQPGGRHFKFLESFAPEIIGEAILRPGMRMVARYRGTGDDRFDRTRLTHYAEPVLIPEVRSKERVVGTIVKLDDNADLITQFVKVIGQEKAFPMTVWDTEDGQNVMVHVRGRESSDTLYRDDPTIYRYADGRVRFLDTAHLIELYGTKLPKGPKDECKRDLVGDTEHGKLYKIPITQLYWYDINAGTNQRRVAVDIKHPVLGHTLPAFAFVDR